MLDVRKKYEYSQVSLKLFIFEREREEKERIMQRYHKMLIYKSSSNLYFLNFFLIHLLIKFSNLIFIIELKKYLSTDTYYVISENATKF